jgi:hypothetical protein
MNTDRQQEANETRQKAAAEFRHSPQDKKMFGTTDWYVVVTERGTIKQMRECDIAGDPKVVGVLCGPYFTKGQAKDESSGYSPKDNTTEHVHRVWVDGTGYVEIK